MGAAASSGSGEQNGGIVAEQADKIHKLSEDLESAKVQIKTLKSELESAKSGNDAVRPSIVAKNSVAIKAAADDKVAAAGNVRRGEVSAEAWTGMQQNQASAEYKPVVVPKAESVKVLIKGSVDNNILFNGLNDEEKSECVDAFFSVSLKEGEMATTQGEMGDKFYVVEEGALQILVSLNAAAPAAHYGDLGPKDSFGELSLMYNQPRAATIKAATACTLWAINRNDFRSIHMHHKMLKKAKYESYLRKVPDLQGLTSQEVARLAEAVEEEKFEKGSVVIREGEVGDSFYIIVDGTVEYSKKDDGVVGTGSSGDYFGHKALLTEETRAATVTATSEALCLTMGRNDFVSLLGSLQELSAREPQITSGNDEAVGDAEAEFANKYHKDIRYEDLILTFKQKGRGGEREIVLGQGAFGRVQIVKHAETGETFALKCLNKSQIVENCLEAHVVDERKVMTMIDHPFLLKLHNSYWDDKYVYLLLELCLGGELFSVLRRAGRFAEKASRFYSATVLQAFGHLHSKDIVYRDLKPENLMLDDKGYIKVVDFGLAKVVKECTWTLCGTPDYLAPEIILSRGHDKAVDYWALGVLAYEMTAGYVPFYAEDPIDVYSLILDGEIKFPSHFTRTCCDLICKLLNHNQGKRLGNTKEGIQAIVKHRFFSGFDWEGLYARTIVPPIRPKVADAEDTSNFDEYNTDRHVAPVCDWQPPFPHQIK